MILLSAIMFTAGLLYHVIKWGIQKSISIKFYEHENNALWYLWFLSFTLPLLPLVDHWTLLAAIGCIILVGAAPNFKGTTIEEYAHIGGAYFGIIFAFIYLIVKGEYIIPVVMAAFTVYAALKLKNKTTWIEIAAMYFTLLGLYFIR